MFTGFDLSIYTATAISINGKRGFLFADVCRSSHLHTNSRCTAAEIKPLDCNNDTTKQQELGNSCIVTKSPCHSLTVFLAVLVTQRQEVSTISKAGVLLGVVFVCLLGVFFSLFFYLFFFSVIFIYISSRHRVLVTRSLSGLSSIAFRHMSNWTNE